MDVPLEFLRQVPSVTSITFHWLWFDMTDINSQYYVSGQWSVTKVVPSVRFLSYRTKLPMLVDSKSNGTLVMYILIFFEKLGFWNYLLTYRYHFLVLSARLLSLGCGSVDWRTAWVNVHYFLYIIWSLLWAVAIVKFPHHAVMAYNYTSVAVWIWHTELMWSCHLAVWWLECIVKWHLHYNSWGRI